MATERLPGEREAGEGRRFPVGLVAALTFGAGLIVLLLLFPEAERARVEPFEGVDPRAFEAHVEEALEPISTRPLTALRIVARQVVWRDGAGAPLLEAPSVVFTLDIAAAAGGGIVIRSGVIENPSVRLVQYASGEWNYESVFDPLLDGGGGRGNGGAGSPRVLLRNLLVESATVTVERPDARYAARSLDIRLSSAELSGPGVVDPLFRIASAEGILELPDTAGGIITRPVALEDARLRILEGALAFEIESGTFGESSFAAATGVWNPAAGGYGVDAQLTVTELRLADVPWLRAEVPADASGSFRLRIEPLPGDRIALALSGLNVRSAGSAATGSLRAIFGPGGFALESVDLELDPLALSLVEAFTGPLPYTGTLRGSLTGTGGDIQFDLVASLATSAAATPFATQLTGRVAFTDTGLEIRNVTAQLDNAPLSALEAIAPGLPFSGPISGTISLAGAPGAAPITIDVRLEAGGGIVMLAGTVDVRGAVPAYDLEGRLVGVELRRVLALAAPPAQVHASFTLEGTGVEPATANAAVTLNGTFTGWESEPGDTIAVVATARSGLLDAESFRIELGPIAAVAEGEWRFAGGSGGAIRYDVVVESLESLAPYLPADPQGRRRFARGTLEAQGTLAGTLEAPVVAGELSAREFRYGEWAAERLDGEYDVRLAAGLPVAQVEITGTEIRSPAGDFQSLGLTLDFTRPTFSFALAADQEGGGVIEIQAGGRIEEAGGREITLRTVEIDLEDQRWRLPSPAQIAWTQGEAVRVENLYLEQTEGDGLVRLEGIVAPFDQADFAIEVRTLPVGEVMDLVGMDIGLTGNLSLDGTVRGPAESPVVDLEVALAQGSIRDVPITTAEAHIQYAGAELDVEGAAVLADSAHVEMDGTLPVRIALGFPPTAELIDGGAIDARFVTDHFPLATIDPGIRSVQDLEGLLRADVRIAGTPDAPLLSGDLELVDGEVTVPLLDQRYTEMSGLAVLNGRQLRIDRLSARSGGTATVEGLVTFESLTDPALDLTVSLNDFEAQGVDNADAARAIGTLTIGGTAQAPVVSGRVALDNGTLALAPFTGGAEFTDRLVGVAESFEGFTPGELDLPDEPDAPIRVADLEIVAGEDLWFATEELRAQLRGTLDVSTAADDFIIVGTLQGDQGTFNLRVGPVTRRFDIVEANIRFLGDPDPNPALDVTASRTIRTGEGGAVEVRVHVSGTLENPQLDLGTAEGTTVAESELLSYVLFGRPTYALGEVTTLGTSPLQEFAALAGVTDLVAGELGQWDVLEELDQFQLQMRTSADGFLLSNLWVVAGKELVDEVFLTAEFPLSNNTEYWVLGLDWRIDRQWTLEGSYGPVRYIGGVGGTLPADILGVERQVLVIIRRRWTY